MTGARRAGADDADELVRLRVVMLESMDGEPVPLGAWSDTVRATLRRRLPAADATMAAFVVDRPAAEGTGLAACAVGIFDERLGTPTNPGGLSGYIFSVATDAGCRRRGYSTACVTALLGWFAENGVTRVGLRASEDGLPLYEKLGFHVHSGPAMGINL